MTPAPLRSRTWRARDGVSLPCSWMKAGRRVAISPSTKASSGSTVTAQILTLRGRAGAASRSAASGVTLRGLLAKNMKPRWLAPPSSAARTVSGVDSPQILAVTGMGGD